ncbi:MAG: hypothetical protein FJY97_10235, partial [candidate division Zixibacteria bacterium]|nr:hypothetical protein [candidate division Zixibacteria bacterium]
MDFQRRIVAGNGRAYDPAVTFCLTMDTGRVIVARASDYTHPIIRYRTPVVNGIMGEICFAPTGLRWVSTPMTSFPLDPTSKRFTLRSVLIGFALAVFISLWIPYNIWVV